MSIMEGIPVMYKYWDQFWMGYKTIHAGNIIGGVFKCHISFGNFSCPVEDLVKWSKGCESGYIWAEED